MRRLLVGWVAVSAAMATLAHELPTDSLLVGSSYTVVTSFTLTQQDIERTYNDASHYFNYEDWLNHKKSLYQIPADTTVSYYCAKAELGRLRTCGHIDPYYRAGVAAISYCQAYGQINGYQTLVPKFTAPSSFIAALTDHHTLYDTAQGLSFHCVQPLKSQTLAR